MTEVLVLLVACSIMGYIYSYFTKPVLANDGTLKQNKNALASLLFIVILFTLVSFSGLRTWMNDTSVYMLSFDNKIPDGLSGIANIDWSIGANPLFTIYQIILKTIISDSANVFVFITACIVTTSMLLFLKKYSLNFGYSLFLFLSFTVFAFTMAAMKQTLATAIAIWALPQLLNGRKLKATLIIALAMLIHPYVVIYFVSFFASKTIWDRRTFFIIGLALIIGLFNETILSTAIEITSTIGEEYELEYFTEGGMNILRIAVYLVVPVMSYIYRKQIKQNADSISLLAVNLSLVSALFAVLASMGGANMFGRMANYFDIFQCIALPVIFKYGLKTRNDRILLGTISVICFSYFYYSYYSKYLILNIDCFYDHISFSDLLKSW